MAEGRGGGGPGPVASIGAALLSGLGATLMAVGAALVYFPIVAAPAFIGGWLLLRWARRRGPERTPAAGIEEYEPALRRAEQLASVLLVAIHTALGFGVSLTIWFEIVGVFVPGSSMEQPEGPWVAGAALVCSLLVLALSASLASVARRLTRLTGTPRNDAWAAGPALLIAIYLLVYLSWQFVAAT